MNMDQWLVRTSDNWIVGPYLAEQVRQMLLDGKLCLQDEICNANGYWIFLHEREELRSCLGVEIPLALSLASGQPSEEEITETETVLDDEITDSGVEPAISRSRTQSVQLPSKKALRSLLPNEGNGDGQIRLSSGRRRVRLVIGFFLFIGTWVLYKRYH